MDRLDRADKRKKPKEVSHQFSHHEGTREKLMKAALLLFAKQGYDGTSTKQICEAAGANIAAITYHFETKENLLNTILAEKISRDSSALTLILKEAGTLEEFKIRVRLFCDNLIDLRLQNTDFHRLMVQEAPHNSKAFEVYKAGVASFRAILMNFLKDARKKGFITIDVDLSVVGFMLFALVVTPASDRLAARINPDLDLSDGKKRNAYLNNVLRVLFQGLVGADD